MMDIKTSFLSQLDAVLKKYEQVRDEAERREMKSETASNFVTSALAAIDRIAGSGSSYAKNAHAHVREYMFDGLRSLHASNITLLGGVVSALRDDVAADFLLSARELIHGELFSDFLEMADFLLSEGYKDAAAVIGGGVLEEHLRQLCVKHAIDTDIMSGNQTKPKKANQLNNDLAGMNVYSKLHQKNVMAWLDLRNKAAHAEYKAYIDQDVALMLQGIGNFIAQYPA